MAFDVTISNEELTKIIEALSEGAGIGDVCGATPEQLESLYALAYSLYNAGNFKDAGTVFQALCLYNHKDPRFWMGLAGCRQAQDDLKGAIDAYSMAGAVQRLDDPLPFLYAARCYIRLGDKENAVGALNGLLTLGDEKNPEHAKCHAQARELLGMLSAGR